MVTVLESSCSSFAFGFKTRQGKRHFHTRHTLHIAAQESSVQNQTKQNCHSGKFNRKHSSLPIKFPRLFFRQLELHGITNTHPNALLLPICNIHTVSTTAVFLSKSSYVHLHSDHHNTLHRQEHSFPNFFAITFKFPDFSKTQHLNCDCEKFSWRCSTAFD